MLDVLSGCDAKLTVVSRNTHPKGRPLTERRDPPTTSKDDRKTTISLLCSILSQQSLSQSKRSPILSPDKGFTLSTSFFFFFPFHRIMTNGFVNWAIKRFELSEFHKNHVVPRQIKALMRKPISDFHPRGSPYLENKLATNILELPQQIRRLASSVCSFWIRKDHLLTQVRQ